MIDCASATEAVGVVERSGFRQVNDMLSAKPEAFLSARAVRAQHGGCGGDPDVSDSMGFEFDPDLVDRRYWWFRSHGYEYKTCEKCALLTMFAPSLRTSR